MADDTTTRTDTTPGKPRGRRPCLPGLPDELAAERAINSRQVAELLGVSVITLAQWRARGEGPRFFRAGGGGGSSGVGRQIRYTLGEVLAYREARAAGQSVR